MPPADRNGKLLQEIKAQSSLTHEMVVRIDERMGATQERLADLAANVEGIRDIQQETGLEVALIQQTCAERKKRISVMQAKLDDLKVEVGEVDQTGQMFQAKAMQTWKVIAIIAASLVTGAGLAMTVLKVF